MKRLLPLVFLFLPVFAEAQENYTVPANATQAAEFRQHVLAVNRSVCRRFNLSASCTQAQACTAANAPGGASCTAAQARGANVRIYPDTAAGREEYMTFVWVLPHFTEARTTLPSQIQLDLCAWWGTLNQTQKDTQCSTWGAPAGCQVCQ
jgi:hypothetical protein